MNFIETSDGSGGGEEDFEYVPSLVREVKMNFAILMQILLEIRKKNAYLLFGTMLKVV